jgi:hypothetical protein
MDLDAVLGGIVIVLDLDPVLEREAAILRKFRVAANEVG